MVTMNLLNILLLLYREHLKSPVTPSPLQVDVPLQHPRGLRAALGHQPQQDEGGGEPSHTVTGPLRGTTTPLMLQLLLLLLIPLLISLLFLLLLLYSPLLPSV